jgi:hypothetical protein
MYFHSLKLIIVASCFGGWPLFPALAADPHPKIAVGGTPTNVFTYDTDRCEAVDIPDASLRAFRRSDNTIVAFASHYVNRPLLGPSFSSLHHQCKVAYQGAHSSDPAMFNDRTWIAATWTDDGQHIVALGHNEYQADKFPGRCSFSKYDLCWYNSIVPLKSDDGGGSFSRSDVPHAAPVVAAPFRNEVAQGKPRGYFNPTNIIFSGGYYYTMISQSGISDVPPGECLFRTKDVAADQTWTFFDETTFVPASGSPYEKNVSHQPCKPVNGLTGAVGSIAKISGTNTFAAFLISAHGNVPEGGSVDVSFSSDLLHWSTTVPIMKVTPYWSKACPDGFKYNYASVLSEGDHGRNFDTIGDTATLFVVRMNCTNSMDRDLLRVNLIISR